MESTTDFHGLPFTKQQSEDNRAHVDGVQQIRTEIMRGHDLINTWDHVVKTVSCPRNWAYLIEVLAGPLEIFCVAGWLAQRRRKSD